MTPQRKKYGWVYTKWLKTECKDEAIKKFNDHQSAAHSSMRSDDTFATSFGLEVTKNGKYHIQGCVVYSTPKIWEEAVSLLPDSHVVPMMGTVSKSMKYTFKDGHYSILTRTSLSDSNKSFKRVNSSKMLTSRDKKHYAIFDELNNTSLTLDIVE